MNKILKLFILFAITLSSAHAKTPEKIFLYQNEQKNTLYLLPESVKRGAHPIFTYAIVREEFSQPIISSQHINEANNPDKWGHDELHYYAIDCQYKNINQFTTIHHSKSGYRIMILPDKMEKYPPEHHDFEVYLNNKSRPYSQLSAKQKRAISQPKNPIIQAACKPMTN